MWNSRYVGDAKDDFDKGARDEVESAEKQAVIQALFQDDKRLYEAESMLSSLKPRIVRLEPNPQWTESEYLEMQKELVTTIATNTLAMPAGRGSLH